MRLPCMLNRLRLFLGLPKLHKRNMMQMINEPSAFLWYEVHRQQSATDAGMNAHIRRLQNMSRCIKCRVEFRSTIFLRCISSWVVQPTAFFSLNVSRWLDTMNDQHCIMICMYESQSLWKRTIRVSEFNELDYLARCLCTCMTTVNTHCTITH